MIDITGLRLPDVLAALYNASRPQGMGFLHYDPAPMTSEEADDLLARSHYFDYLKGRVMKLAFKSETEFNEVLYDRDNGSGAAQRAIDWLRSTANVNAPSIEEAHASGKVAAAADVIPRLEKETEFDTTDGGIHVAKIGLKDVANQLRPAVDRALE